jgi:hypothetical protein
LQQSEASFQAKLIKQYEAQGWYVLKLIQTNKPGIPDLILMRPNEVRLVECKSASGRLSKIQQYRHEELRLNGFTVSVERPL